MAAWIPPARQLFTDLSGKPLAGGFVYHYIPGTTTPKLTWLDQAQTTPNVNPVLLDPAGEASIWGLGQYRQLVTDSLGNLMWDLPVSGTVGVQGYIDARDYGLRQSGDDATAIQAAINAAAAAGGATVYLGPGPVNLIAADQIVWPANASGVSIKGDGPQATLINVNGVLTRDLFVLTAGNLAHCQIRDLGFNCVNTGTGGALIHFVNCYSAHVENVRMAGGFYNGVAVGGGANQYLCTIRDLICPAASTTNACVIIGDDTNGIAQGIYIDTCKFAASNFGIYIRNGGGISISDSECLNHVLSGLITSPAATESAKGITVSNLLSDSCGLSAINLGHSGGVVLFVSILGGSANNSQNGIIIGPNPNVNNISIVGVQIQVNKQSAIINAGANAVEISDCTMAGNGTAAANTYDAVVIEGGCILNGVDNNVIGAATNFPAMHRYAISILDTVDYTTVLGNKTGSGGTGAINNASSGTHNAVANNVGT
jgi:hypothetical protein